MFAARSRSAIAVQSVGQLLLSLCATFAVLALMAPALAHDAKPTAAKPQGWSYPFACCANYDCHEVSQTSISERPEGYVIKDTGEVVAYSDRRIKDSPDGEFHWCAHQAGLDAGKTICLFVPPSSY
ncbi:hypothetical protein [Mesorhizobium qingshengii]|uniref:Secreted protein n=1 Tax=Mesorhizobium qingshengii TaxID=1165689 RepID=A0A1G5Y083_9HYPH|nr:hypothetical protein [Mesorhizobium qingshengii]SDA75870.1 hypothetical protein SAMN02927914_02801 [Mesorhizobium qingshengii]